MPPAELCGVGLLEAPDLTTDVPPVDGLNPVGAVFTFIPVSIAMPRWEETPLSAIVYTLLFIDSRNCRHCYWMIRFGMSRYC